jgi:hypothetical protein
MWALPFDDVYFHFWCWRGGPENSDRASGFDGPLTCRELRKTPRRHDSTIAIGPSNSDGLPLTCLTGPIWRLTSPDPVTFLPRSKSPREQSHALDKFGIRCLSASSVSETCTLAFTCSTRHLARLPVSCLSLVQMKEVVRGNGGLIDAWYGVVTAMPVLELVSGSATLSFM